MIGGKCDIKNMSCATGEFPCADGAQISIEKTDSRPLHVRRFYRINRST